MLSPILAPHIGHLYTALLADASCRWNSLKGVNTKLVTGTDEHGLKIQLASQAKNVSTLTYCDQISGKFKVGTFLSHIIDLFLHGTTDLFSS